MSPEAHSPRAVKDPLRASEAGLRKPATKHGDREAHNKQQLQDFEQRSSFHGAPPGESIPSNYVLTLNSCGSSSASVFLTIGPAWLSTLSTQGATKAPAEW